jgi:competence protein ComEC
MLLSHADIDHIGGAVTLLLNPNIKIGRVMLNPDPTKDTVAFNQLRYALCEAKKRSGTIVDPGLHTGTNLVRKGAIIEILYPSPTVALAGVGGLDPNGKRYTSNSLCAAIRVSNGASASVLLGGDVEFSCIDEWKSAGTTPSAGVLVFPHHGGLPGGADESKAALFAREITKIVAPNVVVFSIHRTLYSNPRAKILTAVARASKKVQFVCTQLPDRLHARVRKNGAWRLHRHPSGKGVIDGSMELKLLRKGNKIKFKKAK